MTVQHAIKQVAPHSNHINRIVTRGNELRSLCADLRKRLSFAQESQLQLAQVLAEQHSIANL